MLTNMAALTLTDAASTPAPHVYSPVRSEKGIPTWVDKEHNGGVAIGYSRISYNVREPAKLGGVYRHTVTMAHPFVDFTIPAAPVLNGVARVKCEFLFPDMMSDQQRKDIVKMFGLNLGTLGTANCLADNIVAQTLPY